MHPFASLKSPRQLTLPRTLGVSVVRIIRRLVTEAFLGLVVVVVVAAAGYDCDRQGRAIQEGAISVEIRQSEGLSETTDLDSSQTTKVLVL